MDAASKTFQSATANFEWNFYEKIVHDTTKQRGSMFIERKAGSTTFAADVFDLTPGAPTNKPSKVLDYSGGSLRVYTPAENTVDAFKAGENQTRYESYLTLGFGGSGHDLLAAWDVTDGGPEVLQENGRAVKTEKLILVSKDPGVRNTFRQVTLWIDPARDLSLKQVFDTPSGDQRTAFYHDIRLNTKVNHAPFAIPTKGVSVMQH